MEQSMHNLLMSISKERQIDFSRYKSSVMLRYISSRLEKNNIRTVSEYEKYIQTQASEYNTLIDGLTNNVSRFFRNSFVFETLQHVVIPLILNKKKSIRIWSAGCSSGEEPYSLAILLKELSLLFDITATIFATDISGAILEKAKQGLFSRNQLSEVKLTLIDKYFYKEGPLYRIHSDIISMVHFSYHDISSMSQTVPAESIFGDFDLILCRNVLIYFEEPLRKISFTNITSSLQKNGFLVLGCSEYLPDSSQGVFCFDERLKIVRKI